MLNNHHHQHPNAVCKQVNNPMSISELAARLLSKTLQFIEELRYFINVLGFKERKHQRLRNNKAQIEGCTSDHTM